MEDGLLRYRCKDRNTADAAIAGAHVCQNGTKLDSTCDSTNIDDLSERLNERETIICTAQYVAATAAATNGGSDKCGPSCLSILANGPIFSLRYFASTDADRV